MKENTQKDESKKKKKMMQSQDINWAKNQPSNKKREHKDFCIFFTAIQLAIYFDYVFSIDSKLIYFILIWSNKLIMTQYIV